MEPSYQAYSNLGQTYFFERKFKDPIEALEEATMLGQRQIQAHGNLGRAYYWYPPEHGKSKAELQKAAELSDDALQVNPNNAHVHTLVSEYFAMLEGKDEALEHLHTVLTLRHGDPETEYYTAKIYNLLGDREHALSWLEKAVDSGYSHAEIANAIDLDSIGKEPRFQPFSRKLHS